MQDLHLNKNQLQQIIDHYHVGKIEEILETVIDKRTILKDGIIYKVRTSQEEFIIYEFVNLGADSAYENERDVTVIIEKEYKAQRLLLPNYQGELTVTRVHKFHKNYSVYKIINA